MSLDRSSASRSFGAESARADLLQAASGFALVFGGVGFVVWSLAAPSRDYDTMTGALAALRWIGGGFVVCAVVAWFALQRRHKEAEARRDAAAAELSSQSVDED